MGDRIPERVVHAKGSGTFTVTNDRILTASISRDNGRA
ncbi:catalase [Chroococcidiopsis sp. CCMEE 29]|nr:catalase [Chroococcidiopsis sp. CCMEE 29]